MLRLNLERLATQVVRADLTLYLGSKLKLEQEEGLKGDLKVYLFYLKRNKIQVKEMKIFYCNNMCLVKWLGQAIIKDWASAKAWGI